MKQQPLDKCIDKKLRSHSVSHYIASYFDFLSANLELRFKVYKQNAITEVI